MKTYLFIFQTAPYESTKALEGIELALAIAAFAQTVSIIFTDNGILQLLKHQTAGVISFKDFTKVYKGLDIFDVKDVYLDGSSLQKFNLNPENLLISTTVVDSKKINELINQHQIVLTF